MPGVGRVAGVILHTESLPWLESSIMMSTPAFTSAFTLSRSSGLVPTAAPTLYLQVSMCCFRALLIDRAGGHR